MFLTITLKILEIPAYSCFFFFFLLPHLLLTLQPTPQLKLISTFSYTLAPPPPPKLAHVHYGIKSNELSHPSF